MPRYTEEGDTTLSTDEILPIRDTGMTGEAPLACRNCSFDVAVSFQTSNTNCTHDQLQ